jgi:isoleucyl-tRNA synthetase
MIIDFPADFIAEGVDQTWWFYLACYSHFSFFDKVAYKNVVSNWF